MPVMVPVGADVDHFAAARFIDVFAFDVRFFHPHGRREKALKDLHRRNRQFFFGFLRQAFFFLPGPFDFFERLLAHFRRFPATAEVQRPRPLVVDVAVEAQ